MPKETVLEACRTAGKGTYLSYGVTLSSFTCFQRLPLELRCKIWTEARPRPRTLVIRICDWNILMLRKLLISALRFGHLLVNREARRMFLQCYSRIFPADRHPMGFYLNYAKDTLCIYLDRLSWFLEDFPGFMKNVRYLDVDYRHSRGNLKFQDMKNLRLVTVRNLSQIKIRYPWKDMADTIQWLKVELQRGRDEGGSPHVRLGFICRATIYLLAK